MSLPQSPAVDSLPQQRASTFDHRGSSKRKLDDVDDHDAIFSDLISIRMRKDNTESSTGHNLQQPPSISSTNQLPTRVSDASAPTSSSPNDFPSTPSPLRRSQSRLQFFIRMISDGTHIVITANLTDSVKSLHERIREMTGIPVIEQRLIYEGKQLQYENKLSDYSIEKDSILHLGGRMRSTRHPRTCQLINDMVSYICRICKSILPCGFHQYVSKQIKELMHQFFILTPKDDNEDALGHLNVFLSNSAPAALVTLYVSSVKGNKECAEGAIKHFLNSCRNSLPKNLHLQCVPIVMEFCNLLRKVGSDDPLYIVCRSCLGSLLENGGGACGWRYRGGEEGKGAVVMQEIFPFVSELGSKLFKDLMGSVGPSVVDVKDFSAFLVPLHSMISEQGACRVPVSVPLNKRAFNYPLYAKEIEHLHVIFFDLLNIMEKCLGKMQDSSHLKMNGEGELNHTGWSQYLAILKELNNIAKLYKGAEEKFWTVLRLRKASLCVLIVRYAKRTEDHQWLLRNKDVTDFESRRHLAMMMFPEVKEDYEELHEMLIDRSQLLAESFEYIVHADSDALHGGLFLEFKNEEATGPGVLREWFFLVTQALFDPQRALFVACPSDRRRFYPNPASKVDPMHLEYFTFSGRVMALALMHKVQVGIVFDRAFFLQLAGMRITLEDIRDADPCLYSSCKQILQMDPEFIDSDALSLTFVREVEELGSRKVVELCPGGESIVVNSKNREKYVDLLIQHCFVTSISEPVSRFARGFADILSNSGQQKLFFQSLELEDLDWMLYGSENAICVEDWKAHTEYNGYKETDPQISWLWKIIGEMSPDQRKVLLFFWTSVKYLPVEGFRGLASRLYIYKSTEPHNHLPSSHTCFYRLCFPPYPSMAIMQDRLRLITQEHVGCSFGTC
ncbi:PREDICTED: E3 ubiquitin-protein ligase UPL5-like isoform X1 [Populus euphratica]|uniref:HECT-type E3 ubiquitin transferase n=1 Tax=Populus euphratica TaxID=75702 RepID=A0AAJ6SXT7_POPEU|nr:PREDICTED: E3 ubiquitin-protein ligase UPL5-like [Populus euphratica]XP_011000985.1 PREDICTED: E3 ubiquitin-protein ligase UPL5-like isoform X1 [Populus euphratica]